MSVTEEDYKSQAEAVATEIWVQNEQDFLQTGKVTPQQGGGGGSVPTDSRTGSNRHRGPRWGQPTLLHARGQTQQT